MSSSRPRWLMGSLALTLLPALSTMASAETAEPLLTEKTPTKLVLAGDLHSYKPILRREPLGIAIELPLSVLGRVEGVGDYPVDLNRGTLHQTMLENGAAGNVQARVGLRINTRRVLLPFNLAAEYEHDVITGPVGGEPEIAGDGLPNSQALESQLRKAYGRVSLGYFLHLSGGLMTSNWGMGLLANDGAHGWEPGTARFTDPRGGDRVIRVALASGPVTPLGLFAAVGFDWVHDDDVTLDDDKARQLIAAVAIGRGKPTTAGVYFVWRTQEATDGDTTEVNVIDLYAKTSFALTPHWRLRLEGEAALILGTTGLASSPEFPEKDVLQLGVAARASVGYRRKIGAVVDFLYASGDENFDDDQQNAFKPDPNYEVGLLLYRHLMAAQTGRAPHRASDPTLVGQPNEDLDRFPTRGSAANTVAVFPRFWWRPTVGLELYGGPLIAFAAANNADPLNTRLAGGVPRNAFDAAPGNYLGTELDLGARFQALVAGTLLMAGLEGGVLLPGSAYRDVDGRKMDLILGGRVILGYNF